MNSLTHTQVPNTSNPRATSPWSPHTVKTELLSGKHHITHHNTPHYTTPPGPPFPDQQAQEQLLPCGCHPAELCITVIVPPGYPLTLLPVFPSLPWLDCQIGRAHV